MPPFGKDTMTASDPQRMPRFDDTHTLTAEVVRSYQENGFVMLRALATRPEVNAYRPLIQEAVREKFERQEIEGRKGGYGRFFTQVTNIWRLDARLQALVFARRFAKVAADLMGVPGVRLYHDQALFKPAGGSATPWHQDQVYWPLDTTHTITLWMPLLDAPRDMGTMSFAAGSHREGPLLNVAISDESQQQFERLVRERRFPVVDHELNAGDATLHAGWTVHSSHPNSSDRTREALAIIYYADGTRIMNPDSEYRKVDMEAFHPGQKPGDIAASPLNPLLFP
jgi:ectoine hydroxylase-related dioxygenase (phytanoyl-CoA dioxygenase family)